MVPPPLTQPCEGSFTTEVAGSGATFASRFRPRQTNDIADWLQEFCTERPLKLLFQHSSGRRSVLSKNDLFRGRKALSAGLDFFALGAWKSLNGGRLS